MTSCKAEKQTEINFSELSLSSEVSKAIKSIGYETPSPIQAQAIPPLLEGKDILGVAQTGTGKTAAFALPLLSNINIKQKQPQILCLAPTRELAIQVAEAFQKYAQHIKGFKVLPIYGGTDYRGQIRQLERGVHLVVGTPGRVMDHMRKGTLKLDQISQLVLDEADEMLRMGFIDDVEWILEHLPAEHQKAFFSATMPTPIKKLTKKYLKNPVEITIKVKTTTAAGIRQRYVQLKNNEKLDMLTRIMEIEEFDASIVFVRTKNATMEVADRLQARGYAVSALNGDIAQNQREKVISNLKKGKLDIIVATDVAARGLDVERVSHVFNYDVPYDTESYVHRIGRTGRAGREGDAILFVNGRERRMLQAIERATRKKIDPFQFPSVEMLNERKLEQLFSKINAELEKDLTEYQSVIKKYLDEFSVEPEKLAAALASIESDSQPFYVNEALVRVSKGRFDDNSEGKGRKGKKGKQDFSNDFAVKTFRIEVGTSHDVEKKDIVGAIANEAGIESRYMGKIYMSENFSTIELPETMPEEALKDLKGVNVKGKKLDIREADENDIIIEEDRGRRRKPKGKGKTREKNGERKSRGSRSGNRKSDDRKSGERKSKRSDTQKDSSASSDNADKPPKARKKPKKSAAEKKGLEKKARKKKARASNAKSRAD
jgi:ATP-dependent RNA helicase DeaD